MELVHQTVLDSTGVYRVVKRAGDLVEVEVVRSPKLDSGRHVVFTAEAVANMKGLRSGNETVPSR